jgi:succinate dehydrogenase / fumarate reductase cytochrome b subunit
MDDTLNNVTADTGIFLSAQQNQKGALMSDQGWTDKRPMSPHLQVWKFHPTMLTSILHRGTGMANAAGILLVVVFLGAVASGFDAYKVFDVFFTSILGKIVLFGFTVSMMFHLPHGIRYLFWDMGKGFSPNIASMWSVICLVFAVVASVALWVFAGLLPVVQ